MTREDRLAEIRDYVRYLDALLDHVCHRLDALPERTVVLGFSQGVHTASRWVVRGGARPPDELILWGAYLPPDLEMTQAASRLEGVRLILVRGEADRHADSGRREAELERLERWGIAYREISFPGGHEVDGDVLDRLAAGG
jgi:predicted esterase